MDFQSIIKNELSEAENVLQRFIGDESNYQRIEDAARVIADAINQGNKIIACGNGGSHCDAMHFTEELVGRFRDDRKPLPAISISEPGYITCTANDYGFESIFSRYVEALGRPGDVLLAISTSGNSQNVLNAVSVAKNKDVKVVLLTGTDGGKMAGMADVQLNVPYDRYADRIQEIHIKIIHILILLIEKMVD